MTTPVFDPSNPTQQIFVSYGPSPLPNSRDELVDKFIDQVSLKGPAAITLLTKSVSEPGRRVLRAYAERMSSLAVRAPNARVLLRAVIAIVIGGLDQNAREALMVMPLIENSARRLGLDLASIFEEAAAVVGHPGAVNLMVWLTRNPADRTIEAMGFVEAADENGFRYKFQS